MDILTSPHAVLDRPAEPVTDFNENLKTITSRLVELVEEHKALGLAAPQIGISLQVICCKLNSGQLVTVCNPRIVMYGGDLIPAWEGCLSIPGYEFMARRHEQIQVKGFDTSGNPVSYKLKKLEARVFQHEIDHLRGFTLAKRGTQIRPIPVPVKVPA